MSKINPVAANRISRSPFGIALLQAFQKLEQDMNEVGGTDFFGQVGFLKPGEPVEAGQLIPTIHLSLRPFEPVVSQPVELVWEEGSEGSE